jgi:hypothetical protein
VKGMTHRDEIHGDVQYDPLSVALLDTPTVQRLGRVYQLGYGHLVYRGGNHTRLSHCMGSYSTALRLVSSLQANYSRDDRSRPAGACDPGDFLPLPPAPASKPGRRPKSDSQPTLLPSSTPLQADIDARWTALRHFVGWAALLHDVGHIPLGHTLEDEFTGIYEKHDSWRSDRMLHLWLQTPTGAKPDILQVFGRLDLYPKAVRDLGFTAEQTWATVLLICTHKERISEDGTRTSFPSLLSDHLDGAGGKAHIFASKLKSLLDDLMSTSFHPYMADIVANTISAD